MLSVLLDVRSRSLTILALVAVLWFSRAEISWNFRLAEDVPSGWTGHERHSSTLSAWRRNFLFAAAEHFFLAGLVSQRSGLWDEWGGGGCVGYFLRLGRSHVGVGVGVMGFLVCVCVVWGVLTRAVVQNAFYPVFLRGPRFCCSAFGLVPVIFSAAVFTHLVGVCDKAAGDFFFRPSSVPCSSLRMFGESECSFFFFTLWRFFPFGWTRFGICARIRHRAGSQRCFSKQAPDISTLL